MKTNETNETLESKLAALRAERLEIEANLAKVEAWEKRLKQLLGGWSGTGEIEVVKRQIRDAKFPVWKEAKEFQMALRIVAVDEKFITVRQDGDEDKDTTQYRRRDGMEGQRRKWGTTIDVNKALTIWETHLMSQQLKP